MSSNPAGTLKVPSEGRAIARQPRAAGLSSASTALLADLRRLVSAQHAQPIGSEFPVRELLEKSMHERFAVVLIVEVVGMFPHVAGEHGMLLRGHGRLGVG